MSTRVPTPLSRVIHRPLWSPHVSRCPNSSSKFSLFGGIVRGCPAFKRGEEYAHVENGFGDIVIETCSQVFLPIPNHGVGRERNDGQVVQRGVIANSAEDFGSIHFRKGNIENDDIRPVFLKAFNRLGTAGKLNNFVLIFENSSNNQAIISVVVHDSDLVHL